MRTRIGIHRWPSLRALAAAAISLVVGAAAAGQTPGIKNDHIGIYDLKALHSVPLDPEVVSKVTEGNIVYEKVRFTSVPGVRAFAILSYKIGAQHLPGILVVDRFRAYPRKVEAMNGYVGIEVAPPDGNRDPNRDDSIGGPRYQTPFSIDDQFRDDPNQSYIYHYTVALLRALDYLDTRPEIDLSKTVVTGYSWPGLMVATLHALDDRPAAYVLWHGLGYYADENGQSGSGPALFSRKMYEMYGAGAYASYGTKPMYAGVALDDYFTKLDSIIEVYNHLKGEKAFAYAPNRHHAWTSRQEFNSDIPTWQSYWQLGAPKPPSIGEGTVKADGGKLIYTCTVDSKLPLDWSEILVSYGPPGNWMARTWHSFPLVQDGGQYKAEIPVYDPNMGLYVIGQIDTEKNHAVGNGPQYLVPAQAGVTAATADYPHLLFDPSLKSDLYLRTGVPEWSNEGPEGKGSVIVKPEQGSPTVLFQNIEPNLWKGGHTLHVMLKGDGKAGPLTAYMAYDANYFLDKDVKNYTAFTFVPAGAVMGAGWRDYAIPLSAAANLDRVGTLFFEPGNHTLQIGTIFWN
jgi:hypothetical protein